MRESTLKRFMRMPHFEEHLELHRLDCSSSHHMLDNYDFVRGKQEEFGRGEIAPPPLLTGKDLIAAGYSPGPWFSQVLAAAEDAQLEGRISTKEEALEFAAAMHAASFGINIHLRMPRGWIPNWSISIRTMAPFLKSTSNSGVPSRYAVQRLINGS